VSPTDSALGALADTTTGLKTSYAAMIQQAFQPKWRSVNKNVSVNGVTYSMMQANFSLYWGLAIMLYEATLVSDDTPMDRYLATRTLDPVTGALISHNPTLLDPVGRRIGAPVTTSGILNGLALFELPAAPPPSFPVPVGFGVGCIACHVGAETTSASIRNLTGGVEPEHGVLKGVGVDIRMERMFTKLNWTPPGPLSPTPLGADKITFDDQSYAVNVTSINNGLLSTPVPLPVATYDAGWYNLGVRPTVEDIGLGGAFASSQIADASKRPLSWTRLFQALPDPSFIKVAGNTLECPGAGNVTFPDQILNPSGMPLLTGPLRKTEATDVDGTFKVTSLRNLEIGGPYFHNGGKSTLAQVMDFYNVGGDFANATKAPAMVPLQLTQAQSDSIVSFMLSLTDDRVLYQKAPFDHPELRLPNGETSGADNMVLFPAVGAAGSITPLPRFLNLNPFQR
jgi:cytochrome c peroxidase